MLAAVLLSIATGYCLGTIITMLCLYHSFSKSENMNLMEHEIKKKEGDDCV